MKFFMGWKQRKPRHALTFAEQQHLSEGKKSQHEAEDVFHACYGNTMEGLVCHHIQINGLLAIGTLGLIEEDMATSSPDQQKRFREEVSEDRFVQQNEDTLVDGNQKQQDVVHQRQLLLVSNDMNNSRFDHHGRVVCPDAHPAAHDMNKSRYEHSMNTDSSTRSQNIDSSKCISSKPHMNERDEIDPHSDSSNVHSTAQELSQMAYHNHPFIQELLAASLYICEAAALPSSTGRKDAKQQQQQQQKQTQFHDERNDGHQKSVAIVGTKQEAKKHHKSKISKVFPSTIKSAMLNITPSYLTKYLSKSGLASHEASPTMHDMSHPKKLQKFLHMFRKKKMYGMTQSLPRELDILPCPTKDDDDDQHIKTCITTSRSCSSSSSSSSLSTSSFFSNDQNDMRIVPNRRSNAYLISTDDEFVVIEL